MCCGRNKAEIAPLTRSRKERITSVRSLLGSFSSNLLTLFEWSGTQLAVQYTIPTTDQLHCITNMALLVRDWIENGRIIMDSPLEAIISSSSLFDLGLSFCLELFIHFHS